MIRTLFLPSLTFLLLAGCATLPPLGKQELMKHSDSWQKMVRWGEYEQACLTYAAPDIRQECRHWFPAEGFSVVDQTVQDVTLDDDGKGATITVVVSYVKPPSATLKRVTQRQRWEAKGVRWQLTGPPQEFP
jgi:hypothetical protein